MQGIVSLEKDAICDWNKLYEEVRKVEKARRQRYCSAIKNVVSAYQSKKENGMLKKTA
jgi:hypothetical protein